MENKKDLDVDILGQVFTPKNIVQQMLALRHNKGSILEPSCGEGAFFNEIDGCIGIEFDNIVCPPNAMNMDFFDYPIESKFDTIIGNPPYVKYKSIGKETRSKLDMNLFDERTNLYLFFIEKCIRHLKDNGELIFIVPRDFVKASSSVRLNKFIYESGTITDWIDFGDQIIFPGFSPNCIIFRFEKNNFTRKTLKDGKETTFIEMNGQLIFSENHYPVNFSELFFVKVGAVSGADKYFINENGNEQFVCSETKQTGQTRRMYYNIINDELLKVKPELLNRRLKKFTEKNWYMWGRNHYISNLPRIYVNAKTRNKSPFFIHDCNNYDGSILAIFIKFPLEGKEQLQQICDQLNQVNWDELGFMCDNRYLFTQRSLEQSHLPEIFNDYKK